MDVDLDRWRRLRAAAADAEHDGPTFVQVQEANDRRARARAQLVSFKAASARGNSSGPPMAHAHAGETILPGIGGHSPDDVARSFKTSVSELERRVADAEGEAQRLADRLQQCAQRRAALRQLIEEVRRWAAEQAVRLPDDETGHLPPVITVQGPPPGTHDFSGEASMNTIEKLDIEIRQLQQEAAAVEQAGPSFDERWPEVEAQLLDAEASFRQNGPLLRSFAYEAPGLAYRCHQVAVGAAMVANPKALLDSERIRIKAETANGIPAADKTRKLEQLRRQILQAAARRELAVREIERDGEFQPRVIHPELVIYKQAAVERLAAAR